MRRSIRACTAVAKQLGCLDTLATSLIQRPCRTIGSRVRSHRVGPIRRVRKDVSMRMPAVACALVAVALTTGTLSASVVTPPPFESLVAQAGEIFVGQVTQQSARWIDRGGKQLIVTDVTFRTEQVIKGAPAATQDADVSGRNHRRDAAGGRRHADVHGRRPRRAVRARRRVVVCAARRALSRPLPRGHRPQRHRRLRGQQRPPAAPDDELIRQPGAAPRRPTTRCASRISSTASGRLQESADMRRLTRHRLRSPSRLPARS